MNQQNKSITIKHEDVLPPDPDGEGQLGLGRDLEVIPLCGPELPVVRLDRFDSGHLEPNLKDKTPRLVHMWMGDLCCQNNIEVFCKRFHTIWLNKQIVFPSKSISRGKNVNHKPPSITLVHLTNRLRSKHGDVLPSDPEDEGQLGLGGDVEVPHFVDGTGLADFTSVQSPVLPVVRLGPLVDELPGHLASLTDNRNKTP